MMTFTELRYWLYKFQVKVYEDKGVMRKHYNNPAARLAETPEIKEAMAKYRELFRVIENSKCPVCAGAIRHERQEDWTYDACAHNPSHFSSGFSHDGNRIAYSEGS